MEWLIWGHALPLQLKGRLLNQTARMIHQPHAQKLVLQRLRHCRPITWADVRQIRKLDLSQDG